MFRPLTLISLLADALLCVAVGLGVPTLVGAISWLSTQGWTDTPFSTIITAATAVWGLGLGGEVTFTVDPAAYPQLELSEPFSFMVSVAPLLFAVVIAIFGWRAGARLTIDENDRPWFELVIALAAFIGATVASLQFANQGAVAVNVTSAVVPSALIWLVAMLAGMRVWEFAPWQRWLGESTSLVFELVGRPLRIAAGLIVGVFGLASLALLVALFTGAGRVIALEQTLQLDISGVVTVGLAQLAYLPTALVWAAAWLLGPGFALGEGAQSQLGGTYAGPLPAAPLLGLVPEGEVPALWSLVALPLALAIVLCLVDRMQATGESGRPWYLRLAPSIGGALVAAVALSLCALLAQGSLGPGRLSNFGPHPGWVLLAAFLIFAVAGCITTFVPLESIGMDGGERSREDAAPRPSREPAPFVRAAEPVGAERDHAARADAEPADAEPADAEPADAEPADLGPGDLEPGDWETGDWASGAHPTAERDASEWDAVKRPSAHWPRPASGNHDGDAADASKPERVDRQRDGGDRRRDPREVSQRDLSEVLRRPDEPDIYADLDDDL